MGVEKQGLTYSTCALVRINQILSRKKSNLILQAKIIAFHSLQGLFEIYFNSQYINVLKMQENSIEEADL